MQQCTILQASIQRWGAASDRASSVDRAVFDSNHYTVPTSAYLRIDEINDALWKEAGNFSVNGWDCFKKVKRNVVFESERIYGCSFVNTIRSNGKKSLVAQNFKDAVARSIPSRSLTITAGSRDLFRIWRIANISWRSSCFPRCSSGIYAVKAYYAKRTMLRPL